MAELQFYAQSVFIFGTGLVDRFSLNDRYLGSLPKTVTYDFCTRFQLEQVRIEKIVFFTCIHSPHGPLETNEPLSRQSSRLLQKAVQYKSNNL